MSETELQKIGDEIFGEVPKQDVVTEEAMAEITQKAPPPVEVKPAEPALKRPMPVAVSANSRGILVGSSLDEQYRLAKYYAASGLMPAHFKSPEQVLVAFQFLNSLGLTMAAVRQTMVVNGTAAIWGHLPLAIAMNSGLLEEIEEKILDKDFNEICLANKNLDAEPYAAWCRVKRRGLNAVERVYTQKDADRAGLRDREKNKFYQKYPQRMYKFKARAMALNDLFPDFLQGVGIGEHDADVIPGTPEYREVEDAAKEKGAEARLLTERFTGAGVDSPGK